MFMVASSVVLTVVVLNYHHRTADIHEMPQWVSFIFFLFESFYYQKSSLLDKSGISPMASMDPSNESTG